MMATMAARGWRDGGEDPWDMVIHDPDVHQPSASLLHVLHQQQQKQPGPAGTTARAPMAMPQSRPRDQTTWFY